MANIQQLPDESQVQKIIQLHNEVELVAQTIMQKAVIIGELLTKVKASLPHGTFVEYTTNTFPFKIRTAQMYMKAFARRDLIDSGEINALHQLNEKNAESAHLITSELLQHILDTGNFHKWNNQRQKQFHEEITLLMSVNKSNSFTVLDLLSANNLRFEMTRMHSIMIYKALRIEPPIEDINPFLLRAKVFDGEYDRCELKAIDKDLMASFEASNPKRNFSQFNF